MEGENNMNEAKKISRHPYGFKILWVLIYIIILSAVIYLAVLAATEIRVHVIPSGSVQLSLPYSKYVAGETIGFSIKNNYNSSIYLTNSCPVEPLAVYYKQDGNWVRQHDFASEDSCSDEQRQVSVNPGGTVNGNFDAWPNLFAQPGQYRIVAFVEYYNSLPYQDIEVIAKPTAPTTPTVQTNQPVDNNQTTPTENVVQPKIQYEDEENDSDD